MVDSFCAKLESDPVNLGNYIHSNNGIRYVDTTIFKDTLQVRTEKHMRQGLIRCLKNLVDKTDFHEDHYFCSRANRKDNSYLRFDCFVMIMVAAPTTFLPRSQIRYVCALSVSLSL